MVFPLDAVMMSPGCMPWPLIMLSHAADRKCTCTTTPRTSTRHDAEQEGPPRFEPAHSWASHQGKAQR